MAFIYFDDLFSQPLARICSHHFRYRAHMEKLYHLPV